MTDNYNYDRKHEELMALLREIRDRLDILSAARQLSQDPPRDNPPFRINTTPSGDPAGVDPMGLRDNPAYDGTYLNYPNWDRREPPLTPGTVYSGSDPKWRMDVV